MSVRLSLAVGKIILAWGRLDQQLHFLIRAMERGLREPHSTEGRFSERRKIFRRLCMRLAINDRDFERGLDRHLAQVVRLERKRGRIAHGFAGPTEDGALFFNAPEAFASFGTAEPENQLLENHFTFAEMASLEGEIDAQRAQLARLMIDAAIIWRRERDPTLPL